MDKRRTWLIVGMILGTVYLRLVLPESLYNFKPVTAMCLFAGACFTDKRWALVAPLLAMLLSDCFLGFHGMMPYVYGSFVLSVCLGFFLKNRRHVVPIAGTTLLSSLLFFLITNFGSWTGPDYPHTWTGLLESYRMGLPFFRSTVAGDLFFSAVLFGGLALAEIGLPALRAPEAVINNS